MNDEEKREEILLPAQETTMRAAAIEPVPTSGSPEKPMLLDPPWVAVPKGELSSAKLPSGVFNPMPGGLLSGYSADTGLDISGFQRPVFALAAATIDYAESGHTRWVGHGATRFTVRIALDSPIAWKGHKITHAYYGHLWSLSVEQSEGTVPPLHVEGGQQLGISGWANGSPHLHLGLLLDGHVEQDDWAYILDEREVREVLGSLQNGRRL